MHWELPVCISVWECQSLEFASGWSLVTLEPNTWFWNHWVDFCFGMFKKLHTDFNLERHLSQELSLSLWEALHSFMKPPHGNSGRDCNFLSGDCSCSAGMYELFQVHTGEQGSLLVSPFPAVPTVFNCEFHSGRGPQFPEALVIWWHSHYAAGVQCSLSSGYRHHCRKPARNFSLS